MDNIFATKYEAGEKFTAEDVTEDLRAAAEVWLYAYEGNFSFLLDLRVKMAEGRLSDGQVKGILNCMLADHRSRNPLEPGMYKRGEVIYKVQLSRTTKRPYAKRVRLHERCENHLPHEASFAESVAAINTGNLSYGQRPCPNCGTMDGEPWVDFDYDPDAVKQLTPAMRLTLDEAKALGCAYGTCIVCGRTLSDEKSVEAGIGPVCAKRV